MTPQRIKAIRKSLNLTQNQFGAILGASKRSIVRWEAGHAETKLKSTSRRLLHDLAYGCMPVLQELTSLAASVGLSECAVIEVLPGLVVKLGSETFPTPQAACIWLAQEIQLHFHEGRTIDLHYKAEKEFLS